MSWLLLLLASSAGASTFTRETIAFGGLERTYGVYAPSAPARGLPAVFVLPGGGYNVLDARRYTKGRIDAEAEERGFLVVYPDAVGHFWNAGLEKVYRASREGIDDVGFLGAVADRLVAERRADRRRLYAVGLSNGGCMAHRLACADAVRWAAVASVSGAFGAEAAASCRPARPVPILMVNGTEDPILPWGEHVAHMVVTTLGRRLTIPEAAAKWAALDGCGKVSERASLPDRDPGDGTRWRLTAWRACRAGSEVLLYKVKGGGHTWPNAEPAKSLILGRSSRDVDFEPLLWDFFSAHPLPERR